MKPFKSPLYVIDRFTSGLLAGTASCVRAVVGPNIVSLFGQGAPFLHEHLRRVKDRTLIVQPIIHVRWIGGQRQREFLSGLLPLLVLLSLHAAIVVIFSLLSD